MDRSDKSSLEVLKRARAVIAKPGVWVQRPASKEDQCCMLGALHVALDGGPATSHPAYYLLLEAAGGPYSIGTYNDAPARVLGDVLTVFDKAIELAALSSSAEGAVLNTTEEPRS